jgi:hypothetical protein
LFQKQPKITLKKMMIRIILEPKRENFKGP